MINPLGVAESSKVLLLNHLLEHQLSQVFWRKKLSGGATTTATERHHHVHTKPQRKTLRKANRLIYFLVVWVWIAYSQLA